MRRLTHLALLYVAGLTVLRLTEASRRDFGQFRPVASNQRSQWRDDVVQFSLADRAAPTWRNGEPVNERGDLQPAPSAAVEKAVSKPSDDWEPRPWVNNPRPRNQPQQNSGFMPALPTWEGFDNQWTQPEQAPPKQRQQERRPGRKNQKKQNLFNRAPPTGLNVPQPDLPDDEAPLHEREESFFRENRPFTAGNQNHGENPEKHEENDGFFSEGAERFRLSAELEDLFPPVTPVEPVKGKQKIKENYSGNSQGRQTLAPQRPVPLPEAPQRPPTTERVQPFLGDADEQSQRPRYKYTPKRVNSQKPKGQKLKKVNADEPQEALFTPDGPVPEKQANVQPKFDVSRPGFRPEHGVLRSEEVSTRPERVTFRPEQVNFRPHQPNVRLEQQHQNVKVERPKLQQEQPAFKAEQPQYYLEQSTRRTVSISPPPTEETISSAPEIPEPPVPFYRPVDPAVPLRRLKPTRPREQQRPRTNKLETEDVSEEPIQTSVEQNQQLLLSPAVDQRPTAHDVDFHDSSSEPSVPQAPRRANKLKGHHQKIKELAQEEKVDDHTPVAYTPTEEHQLRELPSLPVANHVETKGAFAEGAALGAAANEQVNSDVSPSSKPPRRPGNKRRRPRPPASTTEPVQNNENPEAASEQPPSYRQHEEDMKQQLHVTPSLQEPVQTSLQEEAIEPVPAREPLQRPFRFRPEPAANENVEVPAERPSPSGSTDKISTSEPVFRPQYSYAIDPQFPRFSAPVESKEANGPIVHQEPEFHHSNDNQPDEPPVYVPRTRPTTSTTPVPPFVPDETFTTTEVIQATFPPFRKRKPALQQKEQPVVEDEQPTPVEPEKTETAGGKGSRISAYKQRVEAMRERAKQQAALLAQAKQDDETDIEFAEESQPVTTTEVAPATPSRNSQPQRVKFPQRLQQRQSTSRPRTTAAATSASPTTTTTTITTTEAPKRKFPTRKVVPKLPPLNRRPTESTQQAVETTAATTTAESQPRQRWRPSGFKSRTTTTPSAVEDDEDLAEESSPIVDKFIIPAFSTTAPSEARQETNKVELFRSTQSPADVIIELKSSAPVDSDQDDVPKIEFLGIANKDESNPTVETSTPRLEYSEEFFEKFGNAPSATGVTSSSVEHEESDEAEQQSLPSWFIGKQPYFNMASDVPLLPIEELLPLRPKDNGKRY